MECPKNSRLSGLTNDRMLTTSQEKILWFQKAQELRFCESRLTAEASIGGSRTGLS